MKLSTALTLGTLTCGSLTRAQQAGTMIPDTLGFSLAEANDSNTQLVNIRAADFSEFDGKVVMFVYHTSW